MNTAKEPATKCLDILDNDAEWVLQGGADGTCAIIDRSAGKSLASQKAHKQSVTGVAWVSESNFLSSSLDGSVKLWNVEQGGKVTSTPIFL